MAARTADPNHFTPSELLHITGVSVAKQNAWYDRRIIIPSKLDTEPNGSGVYRMVVAATVYQFAITATGIKFGVPTKLAAAGARLYSVAQHGRPANTLFENGRTLVLFQPSGTRIVNSKHEDTLTDIFGRPFEAGTALDIGQIIKGTDEAIASTKGKDK
jgi:hypothetical protein